MRGIQPRHMVAIRPPERDSCPGQGDGARPGMGPGDSGVPRQGTALQRDAWSHVGPWRGPGREPGGCKPGDDRLVPVVGTILPGLIQPNPGLMLQDQGPVSRKKKELVLLMCCFPAINW